MKSILTICVIVMALVTQGCTTSKVNDDTINSLALCGAGFTTDVSAKLIAAYNQSGGQVSTGYKDSIKTLIFDGSDASSSDKRQMYESYLSCVTRQANRNESAKLNELRIDCETKRACIDGAQWYWDRTTSILKNRRNQGLVSYQEFQNKYNDLSNEAVNSWVGCFDKFETIDREKSICSINHGVALDNLYMPIN